MAKSAHHQRVFLSFSHDDERRARELIKELRLVPDLEVVSSGEDFDAGTDWQRRLRTQLEASDLVLVLLTPDSVGSKWIQHEMGAAWALRKNLAVVAEDPRLVEKLPLERVRVFVDRGDTRAVAQEVAASMEPPTQFVTATH